ncbi:MAG TPA: dTMP kinase [Syntrophales bacterium]|nr:dTMP kinase [Syntrophales bacterium]
MDSIMKMGRFISFEGIEGCGKTTQIKLAGEYLKQNNIPFIITEEPGGTPIGRRIREILLNKGAGEEICKETEILLFSAARAQHVKDVIIPSLKKGTVVLCDRFYDATIAYQGFGRGLDINLIRFLNDFSSSNIKPDLTFLFDLPVEVGLKRAVNRISRMKEGLAEDRFEREDLEFHIRVREGYLFLARQDDKRFRIIDSARDIETIHREVCVHLSASIDKKF